MAFLPSLHALTLSGIRQIHIKLPTSFSAHAEAIHTFPTTLNNHDNTPTLPPIDACHDAFQISFTPFLLPTYSSTSLFCTHLFSHATCQNFCFFICRPRNISCFPSACGCLRLSTVSYPTATSNLQALFVFILSTFRSFSLSNLHFFFEETVPSDCYNIKLTFKLKLHVVHVALSPHPQAVA